MKNGWDYQLILSNLRYSQLCIIPNVNLISNIGFGPEGTNCRDESSLMHDVPRGEISFPMVDPVVVRRSGSVDHAIFCIRFLAPPPSLWMHIKSKLLLKSKLIRTLNSARKKFLGKYKSD